jgi:trehalose 6-phosphate phosphatase
MLVRLVTTHTLHPTLRPAQASLFLDVDGTLLEFGAAPDAVSVDPYVLRVLHRAVVACDGAVALISGRSLAQLDQMFAPRRWPAAGLHGVERRDARGRLHVHPTGPVPAALRAGLERLAALHPGLLLEDKGRAVALHYRQAVELGTVLEREVRELLERHGREDFQLQPGDYVLELKPAGITKAHAIEAFLGEAPFAGRTPVFAGDDLTDLHGFEAVERAGGLSIAVGPRVSAMVRVPSPADLLELLEEFFAREAAS